MSGAPPAAFESLAVCPQSRLPLRECPLAEVERLVSPNGPAARAQTNGRPLADAATRVLLRSDGALAYPIVDEVAVLLAPEALTARAADENLPLDGLYTEAYAEMTYYNEVSREWADAFDAARRNGRYAPDGVDPFTASDDPVREAIRLSALAALAPNDLASTFPDPPQLWIHLRYESASLWDAYRHLAPVQGKRVLQVGGVGLDAIKFLLAGAEEVWLLGPILEELRFAGGLAAACGVEDRLCRVLGVAEQLPFADASFDAVFAGGSVHHTKTSLALPECARVLRAGGRFASVEPWRGPGYGLGTRLLGKREPAVACTPLTKERVAPLFVAFDEAAVVHHGALTRYGLLALLKLGVLLPMSAVRRLTRLDDALASLVPRLRRTGSSVALLAAAHERGG